MRQLLFLIVSIGAIHAVAQEEFQHEPKITSLVEPYLTHKKVNAVSVGVISNGQVWKKSFGNWINLQSLHVTAAGGGR